MSGRPRTNGGQVVAAVIVGAATGSTLVFGWLFIAILTGKLPELARVIATAGFVFAVPLWGGGLVLVGLPVGTILHLCGARSRSIGAATGAVLSTPALLTLASALHPTILDDAFRLTVALAGQALVGGAVGWVVVHVAYDRQGALA
ncbi:hypothetical protein [Caulobacter endophyticus]|uniref:Uncharacterized protein n=1 Tax=Caulobacter endophyticus TaxID=2172652 RepID=A0A2T9K249_9CAUL|nr:hypothetical protein [Caulobacter endophyticus]PVM90068.1 hypothetical protein DDF67_10680 [Caulobacter endophyticus]